MAVLYPKGLLCSYYCVVIIRAKMQQIIKDALETKTILQIITSLILKFDLKKLFNELGKMFERLDFW